MLISTFPAYSRKYTYADWRAMHKLNPEEDKPPLWWFKASRQWPNLDRLPTRPLNNQQVYWRPSVSAAYDNGLVGYATGAMNTSGNRLIRNLKRLPDDALETVRDYLPGSMVPNALGKLVGCKYFWIREVVAEDEHIQTQLMSSLLKSVPTDQREGVKPTMYPYYEEDVFQGMLLTLGFDYAPSIEKQLQQNSIQGLLRMQAPSVNRVLSAAAELC